jgi:alkanesulfonate monooxygenase SsuD/methylene tetrahydromethanopterin reductase-like flavin-dependent oxidoreductase (luciferase family)
VLDLHGWGDLQEELRAMTKRGEWDRMSELIDDELVQTFAVVGTPEAAIAEVKRRYGDIATRITLQLPAERDEAADQRWRKLFDELRA